MLFISANGSKWAGQAPDDLQALLKRLQRYTLDPTFESFGNFVLPARRARMVAPDQYIDAGPMHPEAPEALQFWGNFLEVSAVFDVRTDDPETITTLTAAIRANQARPDYVKARAAHLRRLAMVNSRGRKVSHP